MRNPNCVKCPLFEGCNTVCLWGTGNPNADIMFIGEAPGADEDNIGTPFVGRAGQKLDEMLVSAGIRREDIYITNACKCRPPGNRDPEKEEIRACSEYLEEEIKAVRPKVIVPMGNIAMKYILGVIGITKHAGVEHKSEKYNCIVIPTFHPAYILRVPEHANLSTQHLSKIKTIAEGNFKKSPVKYVYADTWDKAMKLFKRLSEVEEYSVDIETSGFDFLNDKILCVSFSWRNNTGVTLPLCGYQYRKIWTDVQLLQILEKLNDVLENSAKKIFQNGSFDIKFFKSYGINVKNFVYDTMLMHHLVDENAKGFHDLKTLALLYTDMGNYDLELSNFAREWIAAETKERNANIKQFKKDNKNKLSEEELEEITEKMKKEPSKFSYVEIPEETLWKYASADADATFRIKSVLLNELYKETKTKLHTIPMYQDKSLVRLLNKIVMPERNVLNEMEYYGALLDLDYIDELDKEYTEKIKQIRFEFALTPEVKSVEDKLYDKAADVIGKRYDNRKVKPKNMDRKQYIQKYTQSKKFIHDVTFNVNSPNHLAILLFDVLNLPVLRKSKKTGNPSTDKDVLEYYAEQNGFIKRLQENRHFEKFHKTYVVGMRNLADNNGRVHTNFNSHITVTGRLSSSSPNLQNIPRKSDIKKLFIAPEGYNLVQFDFAQAEFRCWAFYSQDPDMLRDIRNGMDIHKQTASDFWKIPLEEVTKDQRQAAKYVVFGLMYGRGAESVAKQVGITEEEAAGIIVYFFNKYPVAKLWLEQTEAFVKYYGYVINHFGRIRRLPTIFSPEKSVQAEAKRQSYNAPIQSAAADITGISIVRAWKVIQKHKFDAMPILTVHDSIIFEVAEKDTDEFIKAVYKEISRGFEGINVPMEVECEVGKNWNEVKEVNLKELMAA